MQQRAEQGQVTFAYRDAFQIQVDVKRREGARRRRGLLLLLAFLVKEQGGGGSRGDRSEEG